jgi:hypothetical protein
VFSAFDARNPETASPSLNGVQAWIQNAVPLGIPAGQVVSIPKPVIGTLVSSTRPRMTSGLGTRIPPSKGTFTSLKPRIRKAVIELPMAVGGNFTTRSMLRSEPTVMGVPLFEPAPVTRVSLESTRSWDGPAE